MSTRDEREDPRIARTRSAVVDTTLELIAREGPDAVTHQRVAEAARVSRSTLYRYWPQAEDLLFETLAQIVGRFDFSGPGPFRERLSAELKRWRRDLNQPLVRIAFMTIVGRALHDPAAAKVRDGMLARVAEGMRESVERAVERGELRQGFDAELLSARVFGALVWRSMIEAQQLTDSLIEEIVQGALAGWET